MRDWQQMYDFLPWTLPSNTCGQHRASTERWRRSAAGMWAPDGCQLCDAESSSENKGAHRSPERETLWTETPGISTHINTMLLSCQMRWGFRNNWKKVQVEGWGLVIQQERDACKRRGLQFCIDKAEMVGSLQPQELHFMRIRSFALQFPCFSLLQLLSSFAGLGEIMENLDS